MGKGGPGIGGAVFKGTESKCCIYDEYVDLLNSSRDSTGSHASSVSG